MSGELLGAIGENIWMVAKTGKAIATILMYPEDVEALREFAEERAEEHGIKVAVIPAWDTTVSMCFYREPIVLRALQYLQAGRLESATIPPDILECLAGFLYGYRSEEIQRFITEKYGSGA